MSSRQVILSRSINTRTQEEGERQVAGDVVNAMLPQIGRKADPLAEQSEGSSGRSGEKAVAETEIILS